MSENPANLKWLLIIQAGFYIFITLYIVPYNALMPELARTKDQKLTISMFLSLAFVTGMIIASQIPFLADSLASQNTGISHNDYRMAVLIVNIAAIALMAVPFLVINERKYCSSEPSGVNVITSLKIVLSNRPFMLFVIADASFFITLAIITSGALYYVKVLLGLSEIAGSFFLGGMIILSLYFYPLVVKLTKTWGKKRLILISFAIFIFLFLWISKMGELPISPYLHLGILALFAAFPSAVLGILPYAIIAESAEKSTRETGENTEAMFFAVRTFADKFGQTLGIAGFAVLMIYGKDPGNDLGIRLSAIMGLVVCLIAFLVFLFWKE
jgi:GPH family glycoside/pentoside/hexuronide:cation symporter